MATFDPPLPRTVWPFWSLTGVAVVGLPVTSHVYFDSLLRSGTLPPDGDSIAIPIFGSYMLAAFFLPLAVLVTFLSIRRYNGGTLFAWCPEKPLQSVLITVVFGVPILGLSCFLIAPVVERMPAIEFVWTPYTVLLIIWLLLLRAAAITDRSGAHVAAV